MSSDNSGNSDNSGPKKPPWTEIRYRQEVLKAYNERKPALFDGRIISPSRAGLRDIFRELVPGMTKSDKEVVRAFLVRADIDRLDADLENMSVDKFRAMITLMKGKSQSSDIKNVNLLAVLVGFEPRPLNNYLKGKNAQGLNPGEESEIKISEEKSKAKNDQGIPSASAETIGQNPTDATSETTVNPETRNTSVQNQPRKKPYQRYILWSLAILIPTALALFMTPRTPECMQWNGDRYVSVDCQTDGKNASVVARDSAQFLVSRLRIVDSTSFFKAGKVVVWYLQRNGKYEFFDHPGYHPIETGRELKPVSTRIAMAVKDKSVAVFEPVVDAGK